MVRQPIRTRAGNGRLGRPRRTSASPGGHGKPAAAVDGPPRRCRRTARAVLSTFGSGYGFATRHPGGHTRPVGAVAYSGDGRLVATASDDWSVALWATDDPARRDPLGYVRGHSLAVESVAFSPRGRVLATGSDDRTVRLWDVADPARPMSLVTLPPASASVYGLAFSSDGQLLATGGYGGGGTEVRLWDVSVPGNATPVGAITAHTDEVRAVAFGPNGMLGTGGDDGQAFLWDVADPSAPRQLAPLTPMPDASVFLSAENAVRALAIGPEGRWAVIGSDDSTATIFDIGNPGAPEVVNTVDYTTDVEDVAVSSGGLVAVAGGNEVSLWDPARHNDPVSRYPHGSTVWGVAFSPDGRTLGSGADDGALRLWEAPGPQLLGHSAFHWVVASASGYHGKAGRPKHGPADRGHRPRTRRHGLHPQRRRPGWPGRARLNRHDLTDLSVIGQFPGYICRAALGDD